MADPTQEVKGVKPYIPSHLPFVSDEDGRLHADFLIAYGCLGNENDAYRAAIKAAAQLDTAMAAQTESRRSRYIAAAPRGSYKPFIEEDLTRRRLLLNAIRAIQKNKESLESTIDDSWNIPWLSLEISLEILHHTPFNALVGRTRLLADYPGKQILQLHDRMNRDIPEQTYKTATEICRVENDFAEVLIDRFGERIKCLPGSNTRFQRVKPTSKQLQELRDWLPYFIPNVSELTKGAAVPIKSEGMNKMKLVNDLLAIDRFNEVARKERLPQFKELASIPLITSSGDPESGSDPGGAPPKRRHRFSAPMCDVKGIKRALEEARQKRMSIRPTSLAIYVDDVLRGELHNAEESCVLDIKRSARILVITARDRDGEEVPLATHVLVHDRAKSEMLEVIAAGMGRIHCALRFREDGNIEAVFIFTEKVDTVLAHLLENNVMSHTTHAYTLKVLGRIACMPHIVPGIFGESTGRNQPLMPFACLNSYLEKRAPHMSGNFTTIGELAQQLESSIMLGEPEAVETMKALTEAQTLLRWLWAEGYEAISSGDNCEISKEHADCFTKGMRAAIDHLGTPEGSFRVYRSETRDARHEGPKNSSKGTGFNVPRGGSVRHKDTAAHCHKVKPNHA